MLVMESSVSSILSGTALTWTGLDIGWSRRRHQRWYLLQSDGCCCCCCRWLCWWRCVSVDALRLITHATKSSQTWTHRCALGRPTSRPAQLSRLTNTRRNRRRTSTVAIDLNELSTMIRATKQYRSLPSTGDRSTRLLRHSRSSPTRPVPMPPNIPDRFWVVDDERRGGVSPRPQFKLFFIQLAYFVSLCRLHTTECHIILHFVCSSVCLSRSHSCLNNGRS